MRRKWTWVVLFWIVQAAVPYIFLPPVYAGEWPTGSRWGEALTDGSYIAGVGGALALLTLGQALFLLPVRQPGLARRGMPLWLSLGLGGFVIAGMAAGIVLALLDAAWMIWRDQAGETFEHGWWVLGVLLVGWAIATPLLVRFCLRKPVETVLSRIAARLFLGTLVEVMAVIPLNVMMRKRDSCYCGHGTLWTLIFCAGVGWFALGPALFLPLLARRRKRWYLGYCGACGYDMSGCISAARCPECGAGWRG